MYTVFKNEQIYILSEKLGISQKTVKSVLDNYINRLISKLNVGESVRFLNICYLITSGNKNINYRETLSYVSNEIGKEEGVGKDTVFRVLSELGNLIASDVKNFYSYTIRGLVNVSVEEYKAGVFKVRLRSSKTLRDKGVRVVSIDSFKRKIEG